MNTSHKTKPAGNKSKAERCVCILYMQNMFVSIKTPYNFTKKVPAAI